VYGDNGHHIIEAIFKAFARALRKAVTLNENIKGVLSTKGSL
jgi:imidazoleglycerol-phosphate dehydratase